jgi:hypothetical protein
MTRLLIAFFVLIFYGCASIPTDYSGPDSGTVVIGLGATSETPNFSYSFLFRKRPTMPDEKSSGGMGKFEFSTRAMYQKRTPDYKSWVDSGFVLVHSLPAGEYEIYNVNLVYNAGTVMGKVLSLKTPFSIPFSVKPGVTTYLGNYRSNQITGPNNLFGMPVPVGASFVVSNRTADDIAIAKGKSKSEIGEISDATPDVRSIKSDLFSGNYIADKSRN